MGEQNLAQNTQNKMAGNIGGSKPILKPIAGLATNLAGTKPVVAGEPVKPVQNVPQSQVPTQPAPIQTRVPAQTLANQQITNAPVQQPIPTNQQVLQPQLTPEQIQELELLELQQQQILNQATPVPQQLVPTETAQQQLVKQGRLRGRVDNFMQPKPLENSTLKFLIGAGIASAVIYIVTLVL